MLGATVKGDNIRYTVFRNLKNGKKAVVVYNVDTKKANAASVSIDGSSRAAGHGFAESPRPRSLRVR